MTIGHWSFQAKAKLQFISNVTAQLEVEVREHFFGSNADRSAELVYDSAVSSSVYFEAAL